MFEIKAHEEVPSVILLATPIRTPNVTHKKIVNWTVEAPRTDSRIGKEGWIEIWIAPCYPDGEIFYEDPTMLGEKIKIEGLEFEELADTIMTRGSFMSRNILTLCNFLISKGYIDGTVVSV